MKSGCFACLLTLLVSGVAEAQTLYRLTDLGDLPGGGDRSLAYAINNAGQVAGYGNTAQGDHAFLWTDGVMLDLGILPGGSTLSRGYGINDLGHVVGESNNKPFLWDGTTMHDLGDLPGGISATWAFDINNLGQVVGWSGAETGVRAFLWDSGVMTDLGELSGGDDESRATAINDAGQIVGRSEEASGLLGCFWGGNGIEALPDLPGGAVENYANAINEAGQIAGASRGSWNARAVLWENGVTVDLGTLGGTFGYGSAHGINNLGQVVGATSLPLAFDNVAFIWQEGVMTDLNTRIDPNDPLFGQFALRQAQDINDQGQIVGWGEIGGTTHAFLATPIADTPPPSQLVAVAVVDDSATLRIDFDSGSCTGATGNQLLYGFGSQLPQQPGGTFSLEGSRCEVSAPYDWTDSPNPAGDPTGLLWFLVVATDGATAEGSWGDDSLANERTGPGAGGSSGQCGIDVKRAASTCVP